MARVMEQWKELLILKEVFHLNQEVILYMKKYRYIHEKMAHLGHFLT